MRDIITKLEELNVEKEQLNEGLADMAHEAEKDHEVQMARSDCYKSAKYAVAIHKMLKDVSEMEGIDGWVAAKITKAADYLGSVKHYMEGQAMSDVELAVVPVAGDMTDAMTMPQESVEIIEAEERDYICVHAKKGKYECSGTSSYDAAKKAAEHWGLKSTAGIDAHLADEKKTATESIEEGRNDGPMSECCDAPLDGFENGLGRCSDCGEMAGAWNADELDEDEDIIGNIIGKLEKMGVKGKTPQKPRTSGMALPKPKPAEPIGSDPETGATRGLPPEQVYSPQQLQQIANQNRITKPALKKESKFADWSKK